MKNSSKINREETGFEMNSAIENLASFAVDGERVNEPDKIEDKRPSDVIEAFLTYLFL
ncbi:MAG: hypothetical protein ACK5KT_01915 [Dysgonomonas sp.]